MSFTLLDRRNAVSRTIPHERAARTMAKRLLLNSVEFHVEPLPDNRWQFTVKAESTWAFDLPVAEWKDTYA